MIIFKLGMGLAGVLFFISIWLFLVGVIMTLISRDSDIADKSIDFAGTLGAISFFIL